MRVNKYSCLLDEIRIPYLVKEEGRTYRTDAAEIREPSEMAALLNNLCHAGDLPEEHVWLLCFDVAQRMIGFFEVSHGTKAFSVFDPATIFQRALLCGASSIATVHNHPSGKLQPSAEDVKSTEELRKAGEIIGVKVIDHLIIAESRYFSFHEHGFMEGKED